MRRAVSDYGFAPRRLEDDSSRSPEGSKAMTILATVCRRHSFPRLLTSSLFLLALSSCNDTKSNGSGGFNAETSPFGARTKTTRLSYVSTKEGVTKTHTLFSGGTQTLDTGTFDKITSEDPTGTSPATTTVLVAQEDDGTVLLGGLTHDGPTNPSVSVELDEPLTIDTKAPLGEAQTVTVSAKVDDNGTPSEVTATGNYTLIETDVSIDTPNGIIHGCSHFSGTAEAEGEAIPEEFQGTALSGEIWYHPSFGVVKFDAPEVGWGAGMATSSDYGEVDASGHRTLRKMAIMDSEHPFLLDTYDVHGEFDADKDVHALMLLELRWADESTAQQSAPGVEYNPMLRYEFGTTMGIFASALAEQTNSIFFPEENGKGYKYAYGFVSQAAKNEPSSPITYHISASADSGLLPIRVTGRLYYKVWGENVDKSGGGPAASDSTAIGGVGGSL
jgi:hypothetical protein